MCGIIGYYGKPQEMMDTLISGLKRLEYRGYDSAGIAVYDEGELQVIKSVGKIVQLEQKIASSGLKQQYSNLGIAHTRWATHGVPNEENAHPHLSSDGKICLVHNGIIENYQELKIELTAKGYTFKSDTDTEVAANLIASLYKNDLKKAVLLALTKIRGAFAFLITSPLQPDVLIAAKKGSPLVLGIAKDELILASDVSAIINKTRQVVYLEDNEIVEIIDAKYHITNFENQILEKVPEKIDWTEEAATKNGHPHFLLKEIMEQPLSLIDTVRGRLVESQANIKFGGLLDVSEKLSKINRVVLIGVGTAYYAAKMGELYFESLAGIPAKAEMSPEYRYKNTYIDDKTWVIAISQSGETADTVAAIEEAKRKGAMVTGIVNSVGSTISRITEAGVYNHIGPEISVASTKAFTSQVLLTLMHAIMLGRVRNLDYGKAASLISEIQQLPDLIKQVLKQNEAIKRIAENLKETKNLIYLGRKYNYPIALEGALKIKEISYIHAEGLSGGELKHGFIALIEENLPTIAILSNDSVYSKMLSNLQEIKARGGPIILVCQENDPAIGQLGADYIAVPQAKNEELQPLINNVALQLLAYHASNIKGLDVDKPRNLAKSVTVE